MPADDGNNESYVRPSDDRDSQEDLSDRQLEEKKKREAEGSSIKTPQDEAAPATPADDGNNESFDRPFDESGSQDDMFDGQLEERKQRQEAEENGEEKGNDGP